MIISNRLMRAMYQLDGLLKAQNMGRISELIDAVGGLDELINDASVLAMRVEGRKHTVAFLLTLAHANEIPISQDELLCAHYLPTGPDSLRSAHSKLLHATLAFLRQSPKPYPPEKLAKRNDYTEYVFCLELLMDERRWPEALNLVQQFLHLGKEAALMLNAAKALMRRHDSWRSISDHARNGADFTCIAQMYQDLAQWAKRLGYAEIARDLTKLCAHSQELAGQPDQAIKTWRSLPTSSLDFISQLNLARSHCKNQQPRDALAQLDALLHRLMEQDLASDDRLSAALEIKNTEDNTPEERDFNNALVRTALRDLVNTAHAVHSKVFLAFGTLLGYVREGKFLSHDKDIDVGIIGNNSHYDLLIEITKRGQFTWEARHLKLNDTYYVPVLHLATGVTIDIFLYHPHGDQVRTAIDYVFGHRQYFATEPFELAPADFIDAEVYVPRPAERHLQELYGDWRTPNKSFVTQIDSPAIDEPGGISHQLSLRSYAIKAINQKNYEQLKRIGQLIAGQTASRDNDRLLGEHIERYVEQKMSA